MIGLENGRLAPGAVADVTVLDTERRVTVKVEEFASKSRNTPFAGWELRGAPVLTLVGGRTVQDSLEQD